MKTKKNQKSMQFSKLIINVLPLKPVGKVKRIELGSCFCFIEGNELTIDCVKAK